MGGLENKRILLGVTGGIAAYKAAVLCRLLVKEGAQVKVVMTETAKKFITPLTMATISKSPVLVDFFNPENGEWHSHISLGMWADCFLIAPATANTLTKMAAGIADNLLLTTYLSARCPVVVAPAMDVDMFRHPAVRSALDTLGQRGVKILESPAGELASGLSGEGRMAEPENIAATLIGMFAPVAESCALAGKKVLVTAGPTVEKIDPVRYVSNHSTGKMGFALAEAFMDKGASVTVVCGPVSLPFPDGARRVDVVSALEMYESVLKEYRTGYDVVVFCAAVADYRPKEAASSKIKRDGRPITIEMVPNPDIAAAVGEIKRPGTRHVGFALETDSEMKNASSKLAGKNLDMIVMNSLRVPGAGFGTDTNAVTIISADGHQVDIPLESKREVAREIVTEIETMLDA